jgi:hypothetical protein
MTSNQQTINGDTRKRTTHTYTELRMFRFLFYSQPIECSITSIATTLNATTLTPMGSSFMFGPWSALPSEMQANKRECMPSSKKIIHVIKPFGKGNKPKRLCCFCEAPTKTQCSNADCKHPCCNNHLLKQSPSSTLRRCPCCAPQYQ